MTLGPPDLGDKLCDWQLLIQAGGQALIDGRDVLDLGPSYGIDTYMFAKRANTYTAMDSDPTVIEHYRQQFSGLPNTRLLVANLANPLALADKSFDTVLDFGTLDNVLGGLKPHAEAIRVLRPGGIFICSFANRAVLPEATSACGDEQRFFGHEIQAAVQAAGANIVTLHTLDQARGGLIARKRA